MNTVQTTYLASIGIGAAIFDYLLDHNFKKALILGAGVAVIVYLVNRSPLKPL